MIKFHSKKSGGITLFLTIAFSAVIVLFILLAETSGIRLDRYVLISAMDRECEVILSGYNEKIYDRFGLFAYEYPHSDLSDDKKIYDSGGRSYSVNVFPGKELTNEELFYQITRFSIIRFPVDISKKFLDWLKEISSSNIIFTDVREKMKSDTVGSDNSIIDGNGITEIISEVLKNESVKSFLEDKLKEIFPIYELSDMIDDYLINNDDHLYPVFGQKDMFVTADYLGAITEILADFYSVDTGLIYSRLSFEYYMGEMFSCRVNSITNEKNEIVQVKNLRGVAFDKYLISDSYEIEQLIFGYENSKKNADITQAVIVGVRFAVNLLSNILDPANSQKIKTASAALSTAIAIASAGSVAVPPETIECALHVILATCQSMQDWSDLMGSGKVDLIPISGYDKIKLSYRDHLRIMLLCVPLRSKLERASTIISRYKDNVDSVYYSDVRISCIYKGGILEIDKNYFR